MKKSLLILFLFLYNISLLAQHDHSKPEIVKTESIKIDSIEVMISVYDNGTILTENHFEKSKSSLSITYSKYGKSSYQISTKENSSVSKDFWRWNLFKLENGKILNRKESFAFTGEMTKMTGKTDQEYKQYFNNTLNSEFVEKYMLGLFSKIKKYW